MDAFKRRHVCHKMEGLAIIMEMAQGEKELTKAKALGQKASCVPAVMIMSTVCLWNVTRMVSAAVKSGQSFQSGNHSAKCKIQENRHDLFGTHPATSVLNCQNRVLHRPPHSITKRLSCHSERKSLASMKPTLMCFLLYVSSDAAGIVPKSLIFSPRSACF